MTTHLPLIVSWGGGVNSTAMLIGFWESWVRPDLILFADTGGEKPETYAFLPIFNQWLVAHDFPPIRTVQYHPERYTTLEENCLANHTLPSIVFGFRSCAEKWKIRPQEAYLKQWPLAVASWRHGQKVRKAIGFDAGEAHRANLLVDPKYLYWYPLIDWRWGREECVAAIQRAGLPVPRKSACFFCPSSKKAEVLWLKRHHPALYQRAVTLERNAQETLQTVKGLGRRWSWEDLGLADEAQLTLFPDPGDMPCICFDGKED